MSYKELLEKHGSIRKAAAVVGLTKSKFVTVYKKELGLCTGTTGCQNPCEPGRTRCKHHLEYAVKTRDPVKKKQVMDAWMEKNRDHKNEYQRDYQKDNLDKFRQGSKRYRQTPRGRAVEAARTAKYRASKLQATPAWVDKLALLEIYENCPPGHHVDHIIPLQSDQVCGLHVPHNLQYLTGVENDRKFNSFDGTYDNEGWNR